MDFFKIPASELGKNAKIPVYPLGDPGEAFYELAQQMVEAIRANNAAGRRTVFILPVGPTGQYPVFVRLVNRERLTRTAPSMVRASSPIASSTWLRPPFLQAELFDT